MLIFLCILFVLSLMYFKIVTIRESNTNRVIDTDIICVQDQLTFFRVLNKCTHYSVHILLLLTSYDSCSI